MNIVVCLKQVPGTTKVQIDPQTNTLVRQGVENIMNPFDAYALEEGVRLKEKYGGKVTVISMGPPQAVDMLRSAVAVGADESILLSDRAFAGADTLATSYTLAQAVQKIGSCDLVICGRETFDGSTGQVGPEMSEVMNVPFIAYVSQIEEVANGSIRVKRMSETGYEIVASPLPAVITVSKDINTPRLPSLRGLMKSKNAVITTWTAQDISADKERIGQAGSATWVVKIFFPQTEKKSEMIAGKPPQQVDGLIIKLRETKLI